MEGMWTRPRRSKRPNRLPRSQKRRDRGLIDTDSLKEVQGTAQEATGEENFDTCLNSNKDKCVACRIRFGGVVGDYGEYGCVESGDFVSAVSRQSSPSGAFGRTDWSSALHNDEVRPRHSEKMKKFFYKKNERDTAQRKMRVQPCRQHLNPQGPTKQALQLLQLSPTLTRYSTAWERFAVS